MSNMSYCRFQNTLGDLEDCYAAMSDKLSPEEAEARDDLIRLCIDIVAEYGSLNDEKVQ